MNDIPGYDDVLEASERILDYTLRTPVMQSNWFNKQTGADLYFKCENFQKVGAFKFRGACNAILSLNGDDGIKGIVTHSSGNHAQAVALAARLKGYRATIIMPKNAPAVKINAVKGYGADVLFCEPTIEARKEMAYRFADKNKAHFIHPYNHRMVVAGQGTVAKEFLEEVPDLDIIIAPVGGGGLISGTCISANYMNPSVKVVGTEPEWADDAYRSMKMGSIQPVLRTDSVADGLRTSLGNVTFKIMKERLDGIVTVSEEAIIRNMRSVWERMKIIIEPSSAVSVAACLEQKIDIEGKKVGIILTGGNVDLDKLPWMNP